MKPDTPMHAIRLKCLECSNDSRKEVTLCPATKCPLYDWRSGHRPTTAKKESLQAAAKEVN